MERGEPSVASMVDTKIAIGLLSAEFVIGLDASCVIISSRHKSGSHVTRMKPVAVSNIVSGL